MSTEAETHAGKRARSVEDDSSNAEALPPLKEGTVKEARFEGRHMPESFHRLLYAAEPLVSSDGKEDQPSPTGYPQPDEIEDVEDTGTTFGDYSDLPAARREALEKAVLELSERVQKYMSKQEKGGTAGTSQSSDAGAVHSGSAVNPALEHLCAKAARLKGGAGGGGSTARKSELTAAYRVLVRSGALKPTETMEQLLLRKRGKSHSGVLVITVLMGPGAFSCPKDCYYCPNQPGIARSYLLQEPAVLRGYRNRWDPVAQFYDRASALEANGHVVDKIELIILGGTFSFYPSDYAEQFIAGCFFAANTFFDAPSSRVTESSPTTTSTATPPHRRRLLSLAEEIKENENARCRIIGLTVETRPDYINSAELRRFRAMGVTRVQLGIQHLDDDILAGINRDCPTAKTVVGIQRLLDAGFKVDAHWMPDLPGSSYEKDLEMFQMLLDDELNESFQVDQWKVYPTATVPYTTISEWYDKGLYKPYAELDGGVWMVRLLKYILTHAPYRLRLNRIVRDIPTTYIKGGEKRVNLRQILDTQLKEEKESCHDIRERECKDAIVKEEELCFFCDVHRASKGTEYYLSMESSGRTKLFGHLRLRIRDDSEAPERCLYNALRGAALIREVHAYGRLQAVSDANKSVPSAALLLTTAVGERTNEGEKRTAQHRGIGTHLMKEAERIAYEKHGLKKCAVIAGVGARAYYAKLGYVLEDTYMVKTLDAWNEAESAAQSNTSFDSSSLSLFQRLQQRWFGS